MIIVETEAEFLAFYNELQHNKSIIVPIMSDVSAHPVVNTVCALFVSVHKGKNLRGFMLPFNHTEAINLPKEKLDIVLAARNGILAKTEAFAPSKKVMMHLNRFGSGVKDIKAVEYLMKGGCKEESSFYTPFMKYFYATHRNTRNINTIIPIMQLARFAEDYTDYLVPFTVVEETIKEVSYVNDTVIPVCQFMEAGGVHVNEELFVKYYGERVKSNIVDSLVYTEYNPYTSAGRVSNKFGGINFAAIEKKEGTRTAYTTRFENGSLVLIDFESFHLRLIAELIRYKLPDIPVHEYLARQYFGKDEITKEEYEQGKQITFSYLYSDKREGDEIEFFRKTYEFIEKMWENAQKLGYVEVSNRKKIRLDHMEHPTPGKLFNYILQWVETETAMDSIKYIIPVLSKKKSKVTLYTYDSILIDFSYDDGKEVLSKIKSTLSRNGKFPVRLFAGKNYQTLSNITNLVP